MLREQDILLRPLTDDDKLSLAKLLNNKKIWDNLRDYIPYPYNESDAQFFIDLVKSQKPKMTFAVEFNLEFCGIIGLVGQNDIYQKTAEIGYWIGEPFWNKGIATKAVKLITEYGFNQLDFIRIHTGVFEYNWGSMKVLEKNGYEKDGVFKKSVLKNGKIWDEYRYSKIK